MNHASFTLWQEASKSHLSACRTPCFSRPRAKCFFLCHPTYPQRNNAAIGYSIEYYSIFSYVRKGQCSGTQGVWWCCITVSAMVRRMVITEIRARKSNHIHCFMWDITTYPHLNFNGGLAKTAVDIWAQLNNYTPPFRVDKLLICVIITLWV